MTKIFIMTYSATRLRVRMLPTLVWQERYSQKGTLQKVKKNTV